MEILRCFDSVSTIKLWADLEVFNKENIKIHFKWQDSENEIVFSESPESRRSHELWKQSCFEVFFRSKNTKQYFEVNLATTKAWNFYEFEDYRMPQPPVEFKNIKTLEINSTQDQLTAVISLDDLDLSQIEASLCAVLVLKDGRTTYWSTKHADSKPNFHHVDSFTIKRKSS